MRVRAEAIIMAVMSIALLLLFLTPFLNPSGRFLGLDGSVGYIDHLDMWSSSDPLTFLTYTFGDMFCPQIESRSFILNGSQMAFCARDVSIGIGLLIGSVISFLKVVRVSLRTSLIISVAAFALMIADWCIQHFMSVDLIFTRAITGVMFGASVSILICCFFPADDSHNNNVG